ncbi:helix-turn-helix domain-containing protein [Viridibacillus arvi]|uniref:helix-turn-helix domain-containing protein n=1 Tax=Viridibacillus arvi TaxID=263475 RepID=UPI0034CDB317
MQHIIEIKLKKLLKEFNMTQQELCNKTGLTQRTISVLANNKIERIPKTALSKIAVAFELDDIRDLIDFKNEDKKDHQ